MILRTQNKIYWTKFGLKGLILLSQNINKLTDEESDLSFILYCGLVSHFPQISFKEINEIIEQCDLSSLEYPSILSPNEIKELYTKAVGEIGITPNDFYQMTPEEIEWAYEGYLRKKETEANLTKIAFLSTDDDLIRLTEDKGYSIGNLKEREEALLLCCKEE